MEATVIIPTLNEKENVTILIPELRKVFREIIDDYEIIIADGGSQDGTEEVASSLNVRFFIQKQSGYGNALREAFELARGEYIITMDADLSHRPEFIKEMWRKRKDAEIVIASRYCPGGRASMPFYRLLLSRILNIIFARGLSFPIRDLSSGFRLFKKSIISELKLESINFDILEEILIKCYAQGYKVIEVPFTYEPRKQGSSKVKLFKFGLAFLKTFVNMWKLRNSLYSADYEERAFDSIIPLQRYWQRKRHDLVVSNVPPQGITLDIGCGSSRILASMHDGIGLDIMLSKVRFMRKYGKSLVNGSIFALPFFDASFDCVICSQVIEHLKVSIVPFQEITRVLKTGGYLIIGTPDYGSLIWRIIEPNSGFFAPGGYEDEHITHYKREGLIHLLNSMGFSVKKVFYILEAELIIVAKKDN
jgi:dolichol-phosphate mannosyltransferase